LPAVGHCEATVVVAADGATASPGQTRCLAPPSATTPAIAAAPSGGDPGGAGAAAVLAPIAVVAGLVGGVVLWLTLKARRVPKGRR
jgi:hypothetical protein